jgi:hypothetical protein
MAPMADFFAKHRYVMLLDGEADHRSPLSHPVWKAVAILAEEFPA